MGVVILPQLSKYIQSKNKEKISLIQNKSIELSLFLSLPASIALFLGSEEIVSALMSRCDSSGKLLPPESLASGDSVKILSGALANFIATVETFDSEQRIWVLMEIMGQVTRVQVALDQIKLQN